MSKSYIKFLLPSINKTEAKYFQILCLKREVFHKIKSMIRENTGNNMGFSVKS